jgi:hypothetical protein
MKDGVSVVESIQPPGRRQRRRGAPRHLRHPAGVDLETEQMLAEFHAAKTRLLGGSAADRAVVDDFARKLAARGEELPSLLGFELRQIVAVHGLRQPACRRVPHRAPCHRRDGGPGAERPSARALGTGQRRSASTIKRSSANSAPSAAAAAATAA